MDLNHRIQSPFRRKGSRAFCLWSCAVLAIFGIACSAPQNQEEGAGKDNNSLSRVYKFTSDTSHYFSTSHEGKFVSNTDYLYKPNLKNIPFRLGDWEGEDLDSNDPNILYHRFYKSPKTYAAIYLLAVHGTNESQFHTPEVCYIGDGWKIEERRFKSINLRDEVFQVRYSVAKKEDMKHLVLYWYLWPDSRRNITDGLVLLRLSVIIDPSLEDAEKSALDFIKQLSELKLDLNKREVAETFAPVLPKVDPGKKSIRTKWTPYKEKAVAWLKSQIVPNSIVKEPAQDRRNLLISYKVPKDSEVYRYVFSKASLYDNALAIIAFSMAGELGLAERTIEAASRILSPDNDLWFTFNTHNYWPNKDDHSGAIVRSGASAWLGYAIVYHLNTRLVENPKLLEQDNLAMNHLKIARSIADRILVRQVRDKRDLRHGFFTGGEGRYSYRWSEERKGIEEYFIPGAVPWVSIEHNFDIYFFLRDLARISGIPKYEFAANLLKQSILQKSWNGEIRQFNRGQHLNGTDPVQALDCASWGAMFLHAVGKKSKAEVSLKSVSKYFVSFGKHQGYKPYVDMLLYEGPVVNALFFPDDPEKNWNDLPLIWPEGSLGVAMAYIKMGQNQQSIELLQSVLKLQDEEGGLPYATESLQFQFSKNSSVAGTAWLVMVISALEDQNIQRLFWGP